MNKSENRAGDQQVPNLNETDSASKTEPGEVSRTPSIRLDHFLQACGVPTGGQAKHLIQSGSILVNGEVETRRRKKLFAGDEVDLDGDVFVVTEVPESEATEL